MAPGNTSISLGKNTLSGHRSDEDAGDESCLPRLEHGFLQPAQGEQHERGLLVLTWPVATAALWRESDGRRDWQSATVIKALH